MRKFLVLDKDYADECDTFTFRTFARNATVVTSESGWFDHSDAAEWVTEREGNQGDLNEGDHWYLVAADGATRLTDVRVIRVNSTWGGWTHRVAEEGQYERPRRRA